MKSKNILLPLIWVVIFFFSCKGRVENKMEPQTDDQASIGEVVDQIDPQANLIFQDTKNNYWFGSKEKGVYRFDGETVRLFTAKDGLVSNRIVSVQEDRHGNLYFDTPEGVNKYDGNSLVTLVVDSTNTADDNWGLKQDDLWFRMGWNEAGPYRYTDGKLYHLSFPKNELEDKFYEMFPNASYSPYGLYSIYKDSKGELWFGTASLGVYHFDGERINWMYERHLTETPQGGDFGIRSIIEDEDGYYWICNTNYKYKLLPDTSTNKPINKLSYAREIGVRDESGETEYFLSMLADKNGDIWMQSYDNGVWQNTGNELIHYPVRAGEEDLILSSIYLDNHGDLWVGTQEKGAYKYNGTAFEKYETKLSAQ